MSKKIEELIPPLELCKCIPAGKFEDSALSYFGCKYTDNIIIAPTDVPRANDDVFRICPAPVLEEIMEKLRRAEFTTALFTCGDTWMLKALKHNKTAFERDDNPAIAALRLRLEVEGVEK